MLAPDFLIELVSPSDTLARQTAKMQEYATNGVRLGWLVIPATREIHVSRAGLATPQIHLQPATLSGRVSGTSTFQKLPAFPGWKFESPVKQGLRTRIRMVV